LRAPVAGAALLKLLEARKAALQSMICERHRQAREAGTTAAVAQLSANLRAVKAQIAALDSQKKPGGVAA
jgi:hypothetical protein